MGNLREAIRVNQKELVEEIRENEVATLKRKIRRLERKVAKLTAALGNRRKRE